MAVLLTTGHANLMKAAYWAKRFVEVLKRRLISRRFGVPAVLPEGEGTTMRWILPTYTAQGAITALTEGADPADGTALTFTQLDAVLSEYGDAWKLSDLLERTAVTGTMQTYVDNAAYRAAYTLDDVLMGVSGATPTGGLLTGGTTRDMGAAVSADGLRLAAFDLDKNDNERHPATEGGAYFAALLNSEQFYDAIGEGSPAWFQIATTNDPEFFMTPARRTARVYDVEVFVTNNVKRDTTPSPDDDLGFVFAANSFGITSLDDPQADVELIIKPAKNAGHASPLNRYSIIGWKANFGFKVFQSTRYILVKSDATGIG